MASIRVEHVSKSFDDNLVVNDVTLDVAPGEFMVLVGPSGCGKSTLLRMIAGLEEVSEGRILLGDRDVTHTAPRQRDIAMVFQNYALYPHMRVRENLAFGLKLRKTPKAEIEARVQETARILGLDELLNRRPNTLSGGQRQRVAMGRAIIRDPQLFLMDEPLSNLDAKLRVSMRVELSRLHERLKTTSVYVTHDQIEAMILGQRVAVMRDGVLQQVDEPRQLFDRPANLFVAAFIGSPSMNLVEADLCDGVARFSDFELPIPQTAGVVSDGRVILGVRPSAFDLAGPRSNPAHARISVRAEVIEDLGSERHLVFLVDAAQVRVGGESESRDEDQIVAGDRSAFTARMSGDDPVRTGDLVELAVDTGRAYLFDRSDGRVIWPPAEA